MPVPVPGLSHVVQITAGNTSSGALDSAGNVYMWGYNRQGQIGVGYPADGLDPDQGQASPPRRVTVGRR